MSRLTIEIEPAQHRQIKTLATFSGMTIKDYILSKALPKRSAEASETERLLSSAENAKRLREAISTPESQHVSFENIDELKHALGI